jgi:2-enoate reductase
MLIDLLKNSGVKVITETSLLEVTDRGAIVIDNKFKKQNIDADTIVIAIGFKADRELYNKLRDKTADLYLVGDANESADIMNAIWSANEVALNC